MTRRREDLTFKYNLKRGRHGWIRLTPAYSVKIVRRVLQQNPGISYVLDPFSGTGTTGLVCAENGLRCDLLDINPFLIWLARAKTRNYQTSQLQAAIDRAEEIAEAVLSTPSSEELWVPPIHRIDRWWSEHRLSVLARIFHEIDQNLHASIPTKDLLLIAFCRLVIQYSNASFGHQSMSFNDDTASFGGPFEASLILNSFVQDVRAVVGSAVEHLDGHVDVVQADSRRVPPPNDDLYDCVITSPPYANRMSYVRELRPYMYWLGYLVDARDAGELDWKAIGGTWGIASSRVKEWSPQENTSIQYPGFFGMLERIGERSVLLANYVHKYFVDVSSHIDSLGPVLAPGAKVFYIVGNSTFYGIPVPTEQLYAHFLERKGFVCVEAEVIRKRNSKKELYEFVVHAQRP